MEGREFVRNANGTAAWTALSAARVLGANDRVTVGIIGCGGRARTVMREMLRAPNTELAVACNVYDTNAARAAELSGGQAQTVKDFRRLLEMHEIDAVQISTPDHWHAIPTVLALEGGKHVYVEKPFALTIREGRAMVAYWVNSHGIGAAWRECNITACADLTIAHMALRSTARRQPCTSIASDTRPSPN